MIRFPMLLLDYDGTLAETRPAILRSLREAFLASGFGAPSDEVLKAELSRGGTLQTLFLALVPGTDGQAAAEFVRHYRAVYPRADAEETVLFDGVRQALETLKTRGHTLVVLSNKHAPVVRDSVARFGLGALFSAVLGSEPDTPHKPDPEVLNTRILPLFPDAARSDFLMVGDTAADLAFARNTQIASCWAKYGHGASDQCAGLNPDMTITSFPDLLDL